MNKFLTMLIAVAAFTLAGSVSACAEPEDPCDDVGSVEDISAFEIGTFASFGGFGASVSIGDAVANLVEKEGSAATNVNALIAGDACGLDCVDIGINAEMSANEWVHVLSAAAGEQSGETVSALNEGASFSLIGFSLQKFNIPSN